MSYSRERNTRMALARFLICDFSSWQETTSPVGIDLDFDVVRFGEDGDRHRRGMNPAAGFRGRDTLDTVHAALVFELAEDALSFHDCDDFFKAAHFR